VKILFEKAKRITTANTLVYLILLIISLGIIFFAYSNSSLNNKEWSTLISVGTGIVASVIVAFIIDYVNTKRDIKKISEVRKDAINDIMLSVFWYLTLIVQSVKNLDNEKINKDLYWNEWYDLLIDNLNNYDKSKMKNVAPILNNIIQKIYKIQNSLNKIIEQKHFYLTNKIFDLKEMNYLNSIYEVIELLFSQNYEQQLEAQIDDIYSFKDFIKGLFELIPESDYHRINYRLFENYGLK